MTKRSRAEPRPGLQGKSGSGRPEGREDAGRAGSAVRCSSQSAHAMESQDSRRGGRRFWAGEERGWCAGGGFEGAARQDPGADAGERFFEGALTAERKAMIDRNHDLSMAQQAKALNISRGAVYYKPRPLSVEDLKIMRRIDELHLDYPFAGSRMLRDLLNRAGVSIGRRHVATLMKRLASAAPYVSSCGRLQEHCEICSARLFRALPWKRAARLSVRRQAHCSVAQMPHRSRNRHCEKARLGANWRNWLGATRGGEGRPVPSRQFPTTPALQS